MESKQCTFNGTTEVLDGNAYKACEFLNCTLVYNGGDFPRMTQCHFSKCKWRFGEAAERTILFMQAVYHSFGGSGLIERTFDKIRAKSIGS